MGRGRGNFRPRGAAPPPTLPLPLPLPPPRWIWCLSRAEGGAPRSARDLLVLDLTCVSTEAKLCRLRFDCLDASLAFEEELTDALLEETVDPDEGAAPRPLRWCDDEGERGEEGF